MKQCILLAALLILASANPGIQVSLSEATINQVLTSVYSLIPAKILLGDFAYDFKSDLGDVHMDLSNITLTSVTLDATKSVVTLLEPNKVEYALEGLEVEGNAQYDIKLGQFHLTPGYLTFSLGSTNATVAIAVTAVQGRPQISIGATDFHLDLGTVAITTDLPKVFDDIINKEVHDQISTIESEIPALLGKYLSELNAYLSAVDLVITCPVHPLAVDLGLVSDPNVQGDLIVVGLNGTVIAGGKAVPGEEIAAIVAGADLSSGVQIAITDFVVNSILIPLTTGYQFVVTSLPASVGISLDTSGLALLFPELRQKYGMGKPVRITLFQGSGDEVVYWTEQNLNINATTSLLFEVYTQGNWANAATLGVDALVQVDASLSGTSAAVQISFLDILSIQSLHSNIGSINTSKMASILNSLIKAIVLDINAEIAETLSGKDPLPLPAEVAKYLQDEELKVENGYLVLGTDIKV